MSCTCSRWLGGIEALKFHKDKSTCTEHFLTLINTKPQSRAHDDIILIVVRFYIAT